MEGFVDYRGWYVADADRGMLYLIVETGNAIPEEMESMIGTFSVETDGSLILKDMHLAAGGAKFRPFAELAYTEPVVSSAPFPPPNLVVPDSRPEPARVELQLRCNIDCIVRVWSEAEAERMLHYPPEMERPGGKVTTFTKRAGEYQVSVRAPGTSERKVQTVRLAEGPPRRLELRLQPPAPGSEAHNAARIFAEANAADGQGNYSAALDLMTQAAEMGHLEAQHHLGRMYYQGGRGQDEALRWFKRAAERGYAHAQWWVGLFHEYGLGVLPPVRTEAIAWYRRAAAGGDIEAPLSLQRLCAD
jgi:hypothetical protein